MKIKIVGGRFSVVVATRRVYRVVNGEEVTGVPESRGYVGRTVIRCNGRSLPLALDVGESMYALYIAGERSRIAVSLIPMRTSRLILGCCQPPASGDAEKGPRGLYRCTGLYNWPRCFER